jgi:hypothetical protein
MPAERSDNRHLTTDQIRGQAGQPIVFTLRAAVFDRHALTFGIAEFVQASVESGHQVSPFVSPLLRKPTTGIAGCCARAASGHTAVQPRSVMNSRRFNSPNCIRCP